MLTIYCGCRDTICSTCLYPYMYCLCNALLRHCATVHACTTPVASLQYLLAGRAPRSLVRRCSDVIVVMTAQCARPLRTGCTQYHYIVYVVQFGAFAHACWRILCIYLPACAVIDLLLPAPWYAIALVQYPLRSYLRSRWYCVT